MYLYLEDKSVVLPERSVVQITNDTGKYAIRVLFALLARDSMQSFSDLDARVGLPEFSLPTGATLMFNNKSKITYNNGVIETAGSVPKYHGIYYVGNGVIRSFAITDSDDVPFVSVSSQYTSDISNVVWYRILQYVNMYIGADYVTLEGGNRLVFHPECTDEYTETELQFIYTLLTECVVTPKDFSRILLFNGLDNVLTQQHWVSIINYICALPSHDVCILPSILEDLGINNSSMIKDMAEVHFQPRKN